MQLMVYKVMHASPRPKVRLTRSGGVFAKMPREGDVAEVESEGCARVPSSGPSSAVLIHPTHNSEGVSEALAEQWQQDTANVRSKHWKAAIAAGTAKIICVWSLVENRVSQFSGDIFIIHHLPVPPGM